MSLHEDVIRMQKQISHLSEEEQKRQWREYRLTLKDCFAHAMDKSMAYLNVVVIGGYVAYFSIWSGVKDIIEKEALIISGISITISAAFFVLFEVFKIYCHSKGIVDGEKVIDEGNDDAQTISESIKAEEKWIARTNMAWFPTFLISVLTGIAAIVFLLIYLFRYLILN